MEHLDLAGIAGVTEAVHDSDLLRSVYIDDKVFYCVLFEAQIVNSHLVLALLGFAAGNPKKTEAVHVVNIATLKFSTILPQLQVSVSIIITLIRIDTIWVEVKANEELAPSCGAWQVEGELLIL